MYGGVNSSDPSDKDKNDLYDGYRKEKEEVQNLTSLNVLVNNQPWPKYQLQQCDGADEDKVSHNAFQSSV